MRSRRRALRVGGARLALALAALLACGWATRAAHADADESMLLMPGAATTASIDAAFERAATQLLPRVFGPAALRDGGLLGLRGDPEGGALVGVRAVTGEPAEFFVTGSQSCLEALVAGGLPLELFDVAALASLDEIRIVHGVLAGDEGAAPASLTLLPIRAPAADQGGGAADAPGRGESGWSAFPFVAGESIASALIEGLASALPELALSTPRPRPRTAGGGDPCQSYFDDDDCNGYGACKAGAEPQCDPGDEEEGVRACIARAKCRLRKCLWGVDFEYHRCRCIFATPAYPPDEPAPVGQNPCGLLAAASSVACTAAFTYESLRCIPLPGSGGGGV